MDLIPGYSKNKIKNLICILLILFVISVFFSIILRNNLSIVGGGIAIGAGKTFIERSQYPKLPKIINYNLIEKYMRSKKFGEVEIRYLHDDLYTLYKKQNKSIPVVNNFLKEFIVKYRSNKDTIMKKNGRNIKLHSNINKSESALLSTLVYFNDFNICGEVGLAFGTSAISILEGLRAKGLRKFMEKNQSKNNGKRKYYSYFNSGKETFKLISIDPYQTMSTKVEGWEGLGLDNIKNLGLDRYHEWIPKISDEAFPILKDRGIVFDLFFIDGSHHYEDVLNDAKNALMITRVGGVLVFDDISSYHPGSHAADLFLKKYLVTGGILGYIPDSITNYSMGVYVKLRSIDDAESNSIFSKENIDSMYFIVQDLVDRKNRINPRFHVDKN